MTSRHLRPGEPRPGGEPRRYLNDRGYVRLRWLVGPQEYVEVYEHRLAAGMPAADMQVHHINGVKADNRPENLVVLNKSDHAILHAMTDGPHVNPRDRQPLSEYPPCTVGDCGRPAQCVGRSLCLKHYKRLKRHGDPNVQGRANHR